MRRDVLGRQEVRTARLPAGCRGPEAVASTQKVRVGVTLEPRLDDVTRLLTVPCHCVRTRAYEDGGDGRRAGVSKPVPERRVFNRLALREQGVAEKQPGIAAL